MTVQELEDILARLPADMPVLIRGFHIEYIAKRNRSTVPVVVSKRRCECGCGWVTEHESVDAPALIDLGSTIYAKGIPSEAPAVKLYGRWPKKTRVDRHQGGTP